MMKHEAIKLALKLADKHKDTYCVFKNASQYDVLQFDDYHEKDMANTVIVGNFIPGDSMYYHF